MGIKVLLVFNLILLIIQIGCFVAAGIMYTLGLLKVNESVCDRGTPAIRLQLETGAILLISGIHVAMTVVATCQSRRLSSMRWILPFIASLCGFSAAAVLSTPAQQIWNPQPCSDAASLRNELTVYFFGAQLCASILNILFMMIARACNPSFINHRAKTDKNIRLSISQLKYAIIGSSPSFH